MHVQLFSFNLGKLYCDILPGDLEKSELRESVIEIKVG